ncbi:MAG TPA: hypothetical protein HPQ00_12930, partial [Magnetococcales bacterium]|nr:hypothetical protein [Magnetococcales bacterium]
MIRFACVLCWLLYFSAPPAEAATLEFPASLDQGTAVFLRVLDFVPGAKLTGSFNTTPFPITDDGLALIAVDMETPPGDRTLQVTLGNPNGRSETLTQQVVVNKRDYHEEHITLPEGRVSLSDKKDAERA